MNNLNDDTILTMIILLAFVQVVQGVTFYICYKRIKKEVMDIGKKVRLYESDFVKRIDTPPKLERGPTPPIPASRSEEEAISSNLVPVYYDRGVLV